MTQLRIVFFLPLLATLLLGGCQSAQPKPPPGPAERSLEESIEQSDARGGTDAAAPVAAPPPEVLESLLPPLHVDLGGHSDEEPRFDVTVSEMNAAEFFMGLVQETPFSMTVAPGVAGTISLSLKNVTVDEVMEVVRNTYGYEFERTRHGYQVLPIRLQTRIFEVNHLNVLRSGTSGTTVSAGRQSSSSSSSSSGSTAGTGTGSSSQSVSKGSSISTRQTEGDFWTELERSIAVIIGAYSAEQGSAGGTAAGGGGGTDIADLLGSTDQGATDSSQSGAPISRNGRSVAVNPETGLVVVRAMPLELREVEKFLNQTEQTIARQVILEAKVLEVQLNDNYRSGIDWAGLARDGDNRVVGGNTNGINPNQLFNPYTGAFTPFGVPTGSYSTTNSNNASNTSSGSASNSNASSSDVSSDYNSNAASSSSQGDSSYSGSATSTVSNVNSNTTSSSSSSNNNTSSTLSNSATYASTYAAAFSQALGSASFGGLFSLALNIQNFAVFIDLLKTQGDVHVLSSPRVSTVNNQKAVIKVGSDEFFVTGVTSTTDQNGNVTPEIELESFFSGVALDVTPQVSPAGSVTLHIHPTVVEVEDQTKTFTVYNQTQQLPLAYSTTRESDSIVRAASGQVVVIGGLLKEVSQKSRSYTPLLGDLPVVGEAFSHRTESGIKSELVILLRPVVVDGDRRWGEALRGSRANFRWVRGEE
ncbi:secretin N-terminal domain-containing protein [Endothiovibrio diazotrophicus]